MQRYFFLLKLFSLTIISPTKAVWEWVSISRSYGTSVSSPVATHWLADAGSHSQRLKILVVLVSRTNPQLFFDVFIIMIILRFAAYSFYRHIGMYFLCQVLYLIDRVLLKERRCHSFPLIH